MFGVVTLIGAVIGVCGGCVLARCEGGGHLESAVVDAESFSMLMGQAIKSGDFRRVLEVIHSGVDLQGTNRWGYAPIHQAVVAENVEVLEALLEMGDDVNRRNSDGDTPLALAAEYAQDDVVDFLLRSGATVCTTNNFGSTPLYRALFGGDEDPTIWPARRVAYLVGYGADVNASAAGGMKVLHLAALMGSFDIFQLLIESGAEVGVVDSEEGYTVLHAAVYGGSLDVAAEALRHGVPIDGVSRSGQTALDAALDQQDKDMILFLRAKGAKTGAEASHLKGVRVGVQGAVDDGHDNALGLMGDECLFDDAPAGAGSVEHQAESALWQGRRTKLMGIMLAAVTVAVYHCLGLARVPGFVD